MRWSRRFRLQCVTTPEYDWACPTTSVWRAPHPIHSSHNKASHPVNTYGNWGALHRQHPEAWAFFREEGTFTLAPRHRCSQGCCTPTLPNAEIFNIFYESNVDRHTPVLFLSRPYPERCRRDTVMTPFYNFTSPYSAARLARIHPLLSACDFALVLTAASLARSTYRPSVHRLLSTSMRRYSLRFTPRQIAVIFCLDSPE